MILEEFDYDKDAIINPTDIIKEEITNGVDVPKVAVACFGRKTLPMMVETFGGTNFCNQECKCRVAGL